MHIYIYVFVVSKSERSTGRAISVRNEFVKSSYVVAVRRGAVVPVVVRHRKYNTVVSIFQTIIRNHIHLILIKSRKIDGPLLVLI